MKTRKLHNYLRTHRKRAGLSQNEVAYLLGLAGETKVSPHESSSRVPSLETLLAYEAVFGVPTRELYAGLYEKVERDVQRRARALVRKLEQEERPDLLSAHKLAQLRQAAGLAADNHEQPNQERRPCRRHRSHDQGVCLHCV